MEKDILKWRRLDSERHGEPEPELPTQPSVAPVQLSLAFHVPQGSTTGNAAPARYLIQESRFGQLSVVLIAAIK